MFCVRGVNVLVAYVNRAFVVWDFSFYFAHTNAARFANKMWARMIGMARNSLSNAMPLQFFAISFSTTMIQIHNLLVLGMLRFQHHSSLVCVMVMTVLIIGLQLRNMLSIFSYFHIQHTHTQFDQSWVIRKSQSDTWQARVWAKNIFSMTLNLFSEEFSTQSSSY